MKFFSFASLLTFLGLANLAFGENDELVSITFPEGSTCPYHDFCIEYAFATVVYSYDMGADALMAIMFGLRNRALKDSGKVGGLHERSLMTPTCSACASFPGGEIVCGIFPFCSNRRLAPKKDNNKGKPTKTTTTDGDSSGTDPINSYMVNPEDSEIFQVYNSCPVVHSTDLDELAEEVVATLSTITHETDAEGTVVEYRKCE